MQNSARSPAENVIHTYFENGVDLKCRSPERWCFLHCTLPLISLYCIRNRSSEPKASTVCLRKIPAFYTHLHFRLRIHEISFTFRLGLLWVNFPVLSFPLGNVIPFFEVLRLGEHIKRKPGRAKPGYLSTAFSDVDVHRGFFWKWVPRPLPSGDGCINAITVAAEGQERATPLSKYLLCCIYSSCWWKLQEEGKRNRVASFLREPVTFQMDAMVRTPLHMMVIIFLCSL